jgi:hypothetical protein
MGTVLCPLVEGMVADCQGNRKCSIDVYKYSRRARMLCKTLIFGYALGIH